MQRLANLFNNTKKTKIFLGNLGVSVFEKGGDDGVADEHGGFGDAEVILLENQFTSAYEWLG